MEAATGLHDWSRSPKLNFQADEDGIWTTNNDGSLYAYVAWNDLSSWVCDPDAAERYHPLIEGDRWAESPYVEGTHVLRGVHIDGGPDRLPLTVLHLFPLTQPDALLGMLHRKLPRA